MYIEPEGMSMVARRFIIERGGVRSGMSDDRVTQNNSIVLPLPIGVPGGVFAWRAWSGFAIRDLRKTMIPTAISAAPSLQVPVAIEGRRVSSAVAGVFDLHPQAVDCRKAVFKLT